MLAEEAYRRFAGHPHPATAAAIHRRAGGYGAFHHPEAARPLLEESLRLFELAPPSAEYAEALFGYGAFLYAPRTVAGQEHPPIPGCGDRRSGRRHRGAWVLPGAAPGYEFMACDAEEWFTTLQRARQAAEASGDSMAVLTVDGYESALMLASGHFARAER